MASMVSALIIKNNYTNLSTAAITTCKQLCFLS